MRRHTMLAAALLALAGCGNDPNRTDLSLVDRLTPGGVQAQTQVTPAQMARAALEQLSEPVMLAVLEDAGKTALLVPYGENGPVRTWTTLDRQTVALRQGRVVATRGLGTDLMSTSLSDPRGVGGASVLTTLNAANERVHVQVTCRRGAGGDETITLASGERITARRVTERCDHDAGSVENQFWFGPDGRARQSRQWLGPTAGFLMLQVLRP